MCDHASQSPFLAGPDASGPLAAGAPELSEGVIFSAIGADSPGTIAVDGEVSDTMGGAGVSDVGSRDVGAADEPGIDIAPAPTPAASEVTTPLLDVSDDVMKEGGDD